MSQVQQSGQWVWVPEAQKPASPPVPYTGRPPKSTAGELWASWGYIFLFISLAVLYVGIIAIPIIIGVNARKLGYRGHDWLMVFIPYYGGLVFVPKMAWRHGHRKRPYWTNWPR